MRHALLLAALLAVACSDPGTGTDGDGGAGDAGRVDPACPLASTPGVVYARRLVPSDPDCDYGCADAGTFCRQGGVRCVDGYNDPNNCGTCGNVCAAGLRCINSTCRTR